MTYPKELKYTQDHEWVKIIDDNTIEVGITQFAAEQLGDIVEVTLPDVDEDTTVHEAFGTVDSVKTAADIKAPATGRITETNESLLDAPEMVNEAPYEAWMVRIKVTASSELDELLDATAYSSFVAEQEE